MREEKKQASNIDEQGNVLYLDEGRIARKEVGFPPHRNKSNGLGIYNWLLEHVIYMSAERWPLALRLYHMFVKYSVWMKEGGWKGKFYKWVMEHFDFKPEKVVKYAKVRNPEIGILFASAKTGEGSPRGVDWILKNAAQWNQKASGSAENC